METNLKKWIVYCTTNITNGKIYIGVHKTNPEVFDGYIGCNVKINHPSSYMRPTTPFQFAVKKYGPNNFKRAILQIFESEKEAFDLEAQLVNLEFVKRKDTYNAALGGNGGRPGRKVYQFDFNGNLIKTWENVSEICEFYNLMWLSVWNAINYKLSRKGFYWSYSETINVSEYCNNAGTVVYQYDGESHKLTSIYDSIHEASRVNNTKMDSIQRSIKCGYKTNGYYYSTSCLSEYSGKETVNIRNKKLYIYSLNGDFIIELQNTKDAMKFFKTKTTAHIQMALRSGKPYKEYQISLTRVEKMNPTCDLRKLKKKVGQYSETGDLIKTYDSVTSARKEHGAGVSRCLKGQQQKCHNFIFKYIS